MRQCRTWGGWFLLYLVMLPGCGGGSDGNAVQVTPRVNVTGYWEALETVDDVGCGGAGFVRSTTYLMLQDEDSLQVSSSGGFYLAGLVIGDALVWNGDYPENSGTTTVDRARLNVDATQSEISGEIVWSWSDGVTSCSGTTVMTGTRTTPTVTQLRSGDTVMSPAPEAGNSDFYYFVASWSGNIAVRLAADSTVSDLDLRIWDGYTLLSRGESISDTSEEAVSVSVVPGDFIYVEVNTWEMIAPTDYTLVVSSP